jgi:hypothetical protein
MHDEPHDFDSIQREMDDVVSQLNSTLDPNAKRVLLQKLRQLLMEAHRLLDEDDSGPAA